MANGDKAAALGWSVVAGTRDIRLGYDDINYALDRIAEARTDLDQTVLPAVNQPIFSAKNSATATTVPNGTWTALTNWATPRLMAGFDAFASGQLKVKKAGVYRVQAHVQFPSENTLSFVGIQVVKNTLTPDTAAGTVAKNVPGPANSADTGDLVSLVAGDVLALLVRQTNASAATLTAGRSDYDITWSLEWVRA